MSRNWVALIAMGAVAAIAGTAQAQVQSAEVTGGRVQGIVTNGIASFKGIPFAAPPIGANRWRSPQPVVPWTGVRAANAFAPACMQDTAFAVRLGAPAEATEDCLYLNVWTPAKTAKERLPVMVWIYGGAFVGGATNWPLYDGARLAQKGVVLVSVAYRVGPFGFLAHPDLSKESGHGSGNYGLEDQIAALKWVRDNIAKFGGDPHRVTIFGESAGGISVSMLAASPQAKGLYQRAISESGGSLTPPHSGPGQGVPTLKFAEETGRSFLSELGANDIKAARALPADKILAATRSVRRGFWPTLDGHVIVGDQYELYKAGRFNDTPVLIGTNSDEGAAFTGPKVTPADYEKQIRGTYGDKADLILAANPHTTDAEAHTAAKNNFRDSVFAWSTWRWASLQSQHPGAGKAYLYYFDHRTPASPDGSSHASEIGFVFGNLGGGTAPPPSDADKALSELMSNYWVNFAKSGDPNGPALPSWAAFSDAAPKVMHFDRASSARDGVPNLAQLEALDDYFAWRRGH
jgi:para-nitrobenzyl esterase